MVFLILLLLANALKMEMLAHERIAREINRGISRFKLEGYSADARKYEKSLMKVDISIEQKRKALMQQLHELIVKTFSIDPKIHSKEKVLDGMKNNIGIIRRHVIKLRDLDYYLHTTFLEELGLRKSLSKRDFSPDAIRRDLKRAEIGRKDLLRLRAITKNLLRVVISFDARLIKGYKISEDIVQKEEKLEMRDIERLLEREGELLCHLEAKLPPPKRIGAKLISGDNYSHWASRVLALLAEIENNFNQSEKLFSELKKRESARAKLSAKISKVVREKERLLKEKIGLHAAGWHSIMHHFAAASRL